MGNLRDDLSELQISRCISAGRYNWTEKDFHSQKKKFSMIIVI